MSKAEVKTNGNGPLVPVQTVEAPPTAEATFTLNVQSDGKLSLTIRTNSEQELEELLERWEPRIYVVKDSPEERRYFAGQTCPKCQGKLLTRQGRNGRFIGCNRFPDCSFTA